MTAEEVARHRPAVVAKLARICKDRELAEDLAQDTMIRAIKAAPKFRDGSAVDTWLHRIGLNVYLNWQTTQSRRVQIVGPILENDPIPVTDPEQESDLLAEAVKQISEPCLLLWLCNMSYGQIAEAEGLTINCVKSRIYRERKRLRRIVDADLRDPEC